MHKYKKFKKLNIKGKWNPFWIQDSSIFLSNTHQNKNKREKENLSLLL